MGSICRFVIILRLISDMGISGNGVLTTILRAYGYVAMISLYSGYIAPNSTV